MSLIHNHSNTISKILNIIHINVNSLIKLNRRYELNNLLRNQKPDIVLLNETKLNPKHKLVFEKYEMVRKDRVSANCGGGTGILIKKEIKYKSFTNRTIETFKYLETCIVTIPIDSNNILYIISAYYPSGNNDGYLQNELHDLFQSLNLDNPQHFYILAGDLNCKHPDWGNPVDNNKGNILNKWLWNNEIRFRCNLYASTFPSYPRCNSYLDICLADHRINIQRENSSKNCLETLSYDSDHNALKIVASRDTNEAPFLFESREEVFKFNYKRANWKKFQNKITNSLDMFDHIPNNTNLSNSEIDSHLEKLKDIIINAIEYSVPVFQTKDQLETFITPIIRKLQAEKSRTLTVIKRHNRLQHSLSIRQLSFFKAKLKLIRQLIQENIVLSFNKHHNDKLSNLTPKDPLNMYAEAKKQYRNRDLPILDTIQLENNEEFLIRRANIDPDTILFDSNTEKFLIKDKIQILDVVGAYLETVYASKDIDRNNSLHHEINNGFTRFLQEKSWFDEHPTQLVNFSVTSRANDIPNSVEFEDFISQEEIRYIFKNLKGKFSCGMDNIPNIALKNAPPKLILQYCTLFNNMFNNSYFPSSWKLGKVVALPKKSKDLSHPKNLRGITMLPNISKIFESCINTRIIRILNNHNLINENQFGFKYKHSTIHAINLLVSNINWNWNRKLVTGACLIDFQKAFDNIWIPGLIYKMIKHKFPPRFIMLLYNMINDRHFVVSNSSNTSTQQFCLYNGLQQGTVNAPILFNLYIYDLLNLLPESIGFADDIIVYHADTKVQQINEKLQEKFNVVIKYARDWNMSINFDKCETILFRPPVDKCNYNIKTYWKTFGICSPQSDVPNKDVVKYLGIHLDKFLYFDTHVKTQIIKARHAFFRYKYLFFSKHIKPRIKIILYQALVRPIITYGCPIWFNISPSYMERIRKFERSCLRACTSLYRSESSDFTKYISNKILYNTAEINRIDNFIIKLIRNHIIGTTQCFSNNLIMAPYYTSDVYIQKTLESGFVPPEAFLCLDKNGFIQNENGIPIFYHLHRRANSKAVDNNLLINNDIRFDTSVSIRDRVDRNKLNKNIYWWITD